MNTTTLRRLAGPVALTLALVAVPACSSDSKDETSTGGTAKPSGTAVPSQAEVKITDVWARTSPASAENGAVYAMLQANKDDKLVKVAVDASVAAKAELHETMDSSSMSDGTSMGSSMDSTMGTTGSAMGTMSMKPVESIELPAGKTVELKPGGYHIMLLDLAGPLTTGSTFKVTFTFEKAEPITIDATVREG